VYSVLATVLVFRTMRTEITPTEHYITVPGMILLVSIAVMIGLVVALIVMNLSRATVFDRIATWVWSGPAGRFIFRLAARGVSPVGGGAAMMFASTTSSPRAML